MLFKCPCCCQAIPVSELEDSQWRKHVANDLCPYTCVLEDCPTPYTLFVTQKEWSEHAMNDHPPRRQCPCCEGDPPIFKSLPEMMKHIVSQHPAALSDGLKDLLTVSEINIMGITECPLCDSQGPQDSPEIIEHVFQHVHSFSLRSLPWPIDPTYTLERLVGQFDMNYAFKRLKENDGEEYVVRIDHWAETVVPTFDLEKGKKIVLDDQGEGKEIVFDIAGWPEDKTLENDHSLQLCDIDRNPPKPSEADLNAKVGSQTDYFAENQYFKDESGDGRFSSQTSLSSQLQDDIKNTAQQRPKKWSCTLCGLQSIGGDSIYYRHLEVHHAADMKELDAETVELWKSSMLADAYWNAVLPSDSITETGTVAGSGRARRASDVGLSRTNFDEKRLFDTSTEILRQPGSSHSYGLGIEGMDDDEAIKSESYERLAPNPDLGDEEVIQDKGKDRQTLSTDPKLPGRGSPVTPGTLEGINDTLYTLFSHGNFVKAASLQEQMLESCKRMLGKDHPETLFSMSNLASIYWKQRRLAEAEKLLMPLVTRRKAILGSEHPETLVSMANMAFICGNLGQWEEAEEIEIEVLDSREKVLGNVHPSTLTSMHDLAIIWKKLGKTTRAIKLMGQCVQLREDVLGVKNPRFVSSNEILHRWEQEYLHNS